MKIIGSLKRDKSRMGLAEKKKRMKESIRQKKGTRKAAGGCE